VVKNRVQGFTLIELMLATSLLMVVMFSGYYAYGLYSKSWQQRVDVYWQHTKASVALTAINRMFSSTVKYIVRDDLNNKSLLFNATESSILFVTLDPLYSKFPALVELSIEPSGENSSVIYRELSLKDKPLTFIGEIEEVESWDYEKVLFNNVIASEWSFYGWPTFREAISQSGLSENQIRKQLKSRYVVHEMEKVRVIPESMRWTINIDGVESTFELSLPNHSVYSIISNNRTDA